ncbi:conserved hypothetical protein [Parafrankia sp. EAN1pec]|uniref:hypothetical protein n=1 Tax=Parafrankia sp. (strain EAN1pec) TaxID=298653 RepID=UPI00005450D7|nr:conserved hypothetical protein [Frankia sp. EAN1pec]
MKNLRAGLTQRQAGPQAGGYAGAVIDLQVRTECGTHIAHGARGFEWTQEFIDLDSSSFPALSGVCAFLDTVFNERQIPLLLKELDRLPAGKVLGEESRSEIRRLCSVAAEERHRYLWFLGD